MRAGRARALWLLILGALIVPAPALAVRAQEVLPTRQQLPGFTRHHARARRWQRRRTTKHAQALYVAPKHRAGITIRVAVARSRSAAAGLLQAARRGGSAVRAGKVVAQVVAAGSSRAAAGAIVSRL